MNVRNLPNLRDVSGLIHTAIDDLMAVERSTKYRVDMGVWHSPNSHCSVCFAGAVMAKTIECDPTQPFDPWVFPSHVHRQLEFLDRIRCGIIREAWDCLFTTGSRYYPRYSYPLEFTWMDVPNYSSDPKMFKVRLRWLAKKFAAAGY